MAQVVWSDVWGAKPSDPDSPVTRAEAMTVPAVVRARSILLSVLARYPLVAWRGDTRLATQPAWLSRTDTEQSPQLRMTASVDQLLFHGECLWFVQRGTGGSILDAVCLPRNMWRINDGVIELRTRDKWTPANRDQVLHFVGFQDGILTAAAATIRAARNIQTGVAARARSPIPLINLNVTDDSDLTDEELRDLRSKWVQARLDPDGAVAVSPVGIDPEVMGSGGDSQFLEGARNAARLDVANLVGVPATLLDGATNTASLTYSTAEGKRAEFIDYGLNMWRTVFESRLSMDDVTPRGTRIELDLTDLTAVPQPGTGPVRED